MATPLISVVLCTHGRPGLLRRAVRSVVDQSFGETEIIVVADESSAETASAAQSTLRDADVFLRRNGSPGPARSRNLGVSLAAGPIVVFLDDDDTMAPGTLEIVADQPLASACRITHWNYRHVVEDRSDPGRILSLSETEVSTAGADARDLFVKNSIPNSCMAVAAAALKRIPFDERLRSLEDWDALLGQLHSGMELFHVDHVGSMYHHDLNALRRNPTNSDVLLPDYLTIYRKWAAPDAEIRERRRSMLAQAGLQLPVEWF